MVSILCVDDEPSIGAILEDTLKRAGHRPLLARSVVEGLQILARESVDLIISDFRMPGLSGLDFLSLLKEEGRDIPLIMLTGYGSIEHAVTAIKDGAFDYITKPVRPEQLEIAVGKALAFVRLRFENDLLKREVMTLRGERQLIGESAVMRGVVAAAATAAPTRSTVLLQGESGTGKELLARAVHDQSERRERAFITLNCAALPEGLIESALFGHEKGAFTGAVRRVLGAFERADRGTLLLDEISEMRLDLQAKLLRVLQEQVFERVGGSHPIAVDVRVVATTNRDLAAEVAAGRFRGDLFYRLNVLRIVAPPLRERGADIPLFAMRFAARTAAELGKPFQGISPEALALLQRYPWPGNVRELQHAVERAVIMSRDSILQSRDFDSALRDSAADTDRRAPSADATPRHSSALAVTLDGLNVAAAERVLIERALQITKGNRTRAAELLGMSVRSLRGKINDPLKAKPKAHSE